MKFKNSRFSLALGLLLAFGAAEARAVVVTIDAEASSFFKDDTNDPYIHMASIQNYQAGWNATEDFAARNWFIFPLPPLSPGETVVSASLSLYLPIFPPDAGFGYDSPDASEEYAVYGLSPDALGLTGPLGIPYPISAESILDDAGIPDDGPLFDEWFDKFAGGPELGGAMVAGADMGSDVIVPFGATGIDVVDDSMGTMLLIGGEIVMPDYGSLSPGMADIGEGIFHHTHPTGIGGPETPVAMLTIEIIPEPGSAALLASALGLLALRRRR